MLPYPIPVDLYNQYVMMYNQISTGQFPDHLGMERIRIQKEISAIVNSLNGVIGKHLVFRLNSGQLIISGSFEDLKILSVEFSLDDITYYGLVNQSDIDRLRLIM